MPQPNPKNRPKPIIFFDFDGTIVDSIPTINKIIKKIDPSLTNDQLTELRHNNTGNFIQRFNKDHNIDILQEYAPYVPRQQLFPGMDETLRILNDEYTLHIVSAGYSEPIIKFLEYHHIADFFEQVIGSDNSENKTSAMQTILEESDTDQKDAIMITDTKVDIRHANATGIRSIAVTWGRQDQIDLESENPTVIIDEVTDLTTTIQTLLPSQELE